MWLQPRSGDDSHHDVQPSSNLLSTNSTVCSASTFIHSCVASCPISSSSSIPLSLTSIVLSKCFHLFHHCNCNCNTSDSLCIFPSLLLDVELLQSVAISPFVS